MTPSETLLRFTSLPVWRGVRARPGDTEIAPFEIGWDADGFLRQTTDVAVLERIFADYADDDYVHMTPPPGMSDWATRLGEARLDFIARFLAPAAGRSFLEIGSGTLYVANRLITDLGAAGCTIVDPAIRLDGPAPEKIAVRREYFTVELADKLAADVVLGFHVFEHLPNPLGFLHAARRVLRTRDGRVVLSLPDCEWDIRNATLAPYIHEHISYFTDAAARALFARAGFEVVAGEAKNGVISYVLAPVEEPSVLGAVIPDAATAALGLRVERFVAEARRQFDAALVHAPAVAVHGATAGVNSLLHILGAPYSERIHVFDGDAAKTGHYLPSATQAIRHSGDPAYATMGRVFIAVPGYRAEIERFLEEHHGLKHAAMTMLGDPGV